MSFCEVNFNQLYNLLEKKIYTLARNIEKTEGAKTVPMGNCFENMENGGTYLPLPFLQHLL